MLIKFGFRESLFYPSLFVLFLFIRRIIKFFLEVYLLKKKLSYILIESFSRFGKIIFWTNIFLEYLLFEQEYFIKEFNIILW